MNLSDQIKPMVDKMKSAFTSLYSTSYPQIMEAGMSYVQNAEQRFTTLVTARMSNDISAKFLMDRLAEEKDIFMSELKSFEVLGAGIAQEIINDAQKIVIDAVQGLINNANSTHPATTP